MNSIDRMRIHQRCWTKKPDRPIATTIFRLIATTMNTTVLIAVRKKIGSSTSFT